MAASEIIGRITTGLYSLLAEEEHRAPRPAPAAPAASTAPADCASPADFAAELARLLEGNPKATAGRIHLIGLEPIRARLGVRWPRLQDSIHLLASKVISQHLAPDDVFCRYGALDYLIAFAHLGPEAARLKSVAIAQSLYGHFLGDEDLDGIVIRSAVGRVDGSVVFEERAVQDILGDMATGLGPLAVQPNPSLGLNRPGRAPHLDWQYRPVLDRRHNVLSTWCCMPVAQSAAGPPAEGYAVLGGDGGAQRFAELDRMTLGHALADLDDLLANRFSVFVNAPVHFESLSSSRTRTGILDLLNGTDAMIRRFLVLEMYGVPGDISRTRLLDLAGMLRPFCRSILLAADPQAHGIVHARECGVHGVSFDLSGGSCPGFSGNFDRTCRALEQTGTRVAIVGIRSIGQARAAAAAGATYLGGPRIGPPAEVPANMVRYDWNDLLAERCTH